jgi:hypothetical protein
MPKQGLYIESSVWNCCFNDHVPELQRESQEFFDRLKTDPTVQAYLSDVVLTELENAPGETGGKGMDCGANHAAFTSGEAGVVGTTLVGRYSSADRKPGPPRVSPARGDYRRTSRRRSPWLDMVHYLV